MKISYLRKVSLFSLLLCKQILRFHGESYSSFPLSYSPHPGESYSSRGYCSRHCEHVGPASLLLVCTRVHSLSWHSSSSTFSLKPFLASHETSFLLASWSEPKASSDRTFLRLGWLVGSCYHDVVRITIVSFTHMTVDTLSVDGIPVWELGTNNETKHRRRSRRN